MKKSLILLAGFPGTGKSYVNTCIKRKIPNLIDLNFDQMKEKRIEKIGYNNIEERNKIITDTWKFYYQQLNFFMCHGNNIISDYPFSEKQRPFLEQYINQYGYQCITIRLVGDIPIIYERQKKRDLDASRHLSHIMSHYHAGDILVDRSKADGLLTYEEFYKRCTTRGYDKFQLGYLIEVDMSDFSKVNYTQLVEKVVTLVKE